MMAKARIKNSLQRKCQWARSTRVPFEGGSGPESVRSAPADPIDDDRMAHVNNACASSSTRGKRWRLRADTGWQVFRAIVPPVYLQCRYATKSNGRLNPPLRFMYCRYLRLSMTCTSPTSLPSTFLPFVVSKPQKPIVLSISCSSGVLPSSSDSGTMGFICGARRDDDDGIGSYDLWRKMKRRNETILLTK